VKRVGFIVHPARPEAVRAGRSLVADLRAAGVATRGPAGVALGTDDEADADRFAIGLDLAVSVGGDGTFLRAAELASRDGCPVLGVKVGNMGFLTQVEPGEAAPLIERVLSGSARIDERLAVIAEAEGAPGFQPQWALNEVMIEKHARHRLIRLAVFVDGTYVTTFSADGVIVATPTGSTAYSFSARGPIVTPTVPCLVLTPVAAHMVFDRSFVLGAEQRVRLVVVGDEPGLLSADGRATLELPVSAHIRIGAAPRPARLVRRGDDPGFLMLVRDKFGLPGVPGTAASNQV